tara:strand:- start:188 stop:295 length:108 start_codon:yes stop_codon:yes gene_type:complete
MEGLYLILGFALILMFPKLILGIIAVIAAVMFGVS